MATRSDLAALSEGQKLDGVPLSQAEAVALNATDLVTVTPTVEGWKVTAAYAVGALQIGQLTVRVQPKVGTLKVLRLLARLHKVTQLDFDEQLVEIAQDHDLSVVLAMLFAAEAATAMAPGPVRGYRTEDQTLSVLRGRLRMRDQELRRFGQLVPLEVTVDEWTTDTDDNRRLRAATRRLLILPGLPELTRRRLIRLDRQLADVTLRAGGAPVPDWIPTRLNARLHPLLRLADLVLGYGAVEHQVGDIAVKGFVLKLPKLFEDLVTDLLKESATDAFVQSQREYPLDVDARLTIRPDLVVTRHGQQIAVADVKYKLLDDDGRFPNGDAYQLIAYCTRLGLSTGHLIYAAGDPWPGSVEMIGSNVRIAVHAIDLTQAIDGVEAQVRGLFHAMVNRTEAPSSLDILRSSAAGAGAFPGVET